MVRMSTLCYIEKDEQFLMLHRIVKENDINHDKWIGVGGHFEMAESPEDCVLREVKEETGYTLTSYKFRGIVTFIYGEDTVEYMHLYTADAFEGDAIECDEGVLEWVPKSRLWELELWEGDMIFFRLLEERQDFFSLKLVYNTDDVLQDVVLDGRPMELFDILEPNGEKTGIVRERGVAHRLGSLHGTVHIWVMRQKENGWDVLLQKRSELKESNPGCYDISAAGHIAHGGTAIDAARRETWEEIGLDLTNDDFRYVGVHRGTYEAFFHDKLFRDDELMNVYVVTAPFDDSEIRLQEEEVDSVCWMDFEECRHMIEENTREHCMYLSEYEMVHKWLFG